MIKYYEKLVGDASKWRNDVVFTLLPCMTYAAVVDVVVDPRKSCASL